MYGQPCNVIGKVKHECILSFIVNEICDFSRNTDVEDDNIRAAIMTYNGSTRRLIFIKIESLQRQKDKFTISLYLEHPDKCKESILTRHWTSSDIARGIERLCKASTFDETMTAVEEIQSITIAIELRPRENDVTK